jgi:hypothetical protein
MAQFKAFDPCVEVTGESVQAVVEGMGAFKQAALKILAEHGITDIQAGTWHKQQAWLDAFKTIAEEVGSSTLYSIGLKIPEHAIFPPQIDSLGKALAGIDTAYHMNHRNEPIGNIRFQRTGEKSVTMVCDNPYPCDFERGIITAFCNRFQPKGSLAKAKVTHDDSQPCRKRDADSCTYQVTW